MYSDGKYRSRRAFHELMNWTESYSVMNDVANSVNEPDEGESELGTR